MIETAPAVRVVALYDTAHFPSDAYPGLALRVRLNPSGVVWEDFRQGGFHADEREQALADSLTAVIAQPATSDEDRAAYQKRLFALEEDDCCARRAHEHRARRAVWRDRAAGGGDRVRPGRP